MNLRERRALHLPFPGVGATSRANPPPRLRPHTLHLGQNRVPRDVPQERCTYRFVHLPRDKHRGGDRAVIPQNPQHDFVHQLPIMFGSHGNLSFVVFRRNRHFWERSAQGRVGVLAEKATF